MDTKCRIIPSKTAVQAHLTAKKPVGGTEQDTASPMGRLDTAVTQRRPFTLKYITDADLADLRQRCAEIIKAPDAPAATQHLQWIRGHKTFRAAAESFIEFCTDVLQLDLSVMHDVQSGEIVPACNATRTRHQKDQPNSRSISPNLATDSILPQAADSGPVMLPDDKKPEFWAVQINGHLMAGVEAFIKAGQDLLAAKRQLGHGKFNTLFAPKMLRIDQRTAQMLMKISSHPVISKANNYAILPPALNSLYALSAVDELTFNRAIANHEVSPRMTLSEAKSLAKALRPSYFKNTPDSGDEPKNLNLSPAYSFAAHKASCRRVAEVVLEEVAKCPNEEWAKRLRSSIVALLQPVE
ncbi:MAG: hypothetical protein JWR19_827 [Pedosphaera sp.]|nr:hypothetical protein [Pedosphaera sp.]